MGTSRQSSGPEATVQSEARTGRPWGDVQEENDRSSLHSTPLCEGAASGLVDMWSDQPRAVAESAWKDRPEAGRVASEGTRGPRRAQGQKPAGPGDHLFVLE